MPQNFTDFCLKFLAVVVVVGVITGAYVIFNYEEPIELTIENLSSQKTVEILDSYEVVTPLVPGSNLGIHNKIYVVHDNDCNVTCYLYDDGISCIPDRFLEEEEKCS